MRLVLNGAERTVDGAATVAGLASSLGLGASGVAVAVNGEVVARSAWPATSLHEGDRVEVLGAMQGG
ncbi:MAG TPA: sulfur carrier protein ThiS [Acidimicrobiales bacterium]|nr:sulfur carrier protein ThiS [Acidimicrobiales bacterium]